MPGVSLFNEDSKSVNSTVVVFLSSVSQLDDLEYAYSIMPYSANLAICLCISITFIDQHVSKYLFTFYLNSH